jgi:hypothetical protein
MTKIKQFNSNRKNKKKKQRTPEIFPNALLKRAGHCQFALTKQGEEIIAKVAANDATDFSFVSLGVTIKMVENYIEGYEKAKERATEEEGLQIASSLEHFNVTLDVLNFIKASTEQKIIASFSTNKIITS